MTEKIQIKGQDIWIMIEPHTVHTTGNNFEECYTAGYSAVDPSMNPVCTLFTDNEQIPITFHSPVEALEYANEKLLENN